MYQNQYLCWFCWWPCISDNFADRMVAKSQTSVNHKSFQTQSCGVRTIMHACNQIQNALGQVPFANDYQKYLGYHRLMMYKPLCGYARW